ncbi:MAG: PT domain-containing protein, partial [Bacteroidales bacterium]|nr:PT domain-containing protein [Bacteroidales bacterium]
PANQPTDQPTNQPSNQPTNRPSSQPTNPTFARRKTKQKDTDYQWFTQPPRALRGEIVAEGAPNKCNYLIISKQIVPTAPSEFRTNSVAQTPLITSVLSIIDCVKIRNRFPFIA